MAPLAEKRAGAPDLFQSAHEVAAGESIDAELAAHAAAAGGVMEADQLSARDKRMLAIGALTGAAAAIARFRFPFDSGTDTLERTDAALDHARSVGAVDREGRRLFAGGAEPSPAGDRKEE